MNTSRRAESPSVLDYTSQPDGCWVGCQRVGESLVFSDRSASFSRRVREVLHWLALDVIAVALLLAIGPDLSGGEVIAAAGIGALVSASGALLIADAAFKSWISSTLRITPDTLILSRTAGHRFVERQWPKAHVRRIVSLYTSKRKIGFYSLRIEVHDGSKFGFGFCRTAAESRWLAGVLCEAIGLPQEARSAINRKLW